MKIPNIRLLNQQLLSPLFFQPKELVSWMGAMQAQNYSMVKWAVGMRLKSATIQTVEKALRDGEILRTHVMRPTWHLVAAEDIRWMLKLSAGRIISANESYAKGHDLEISEELYTKSHNLLEKILCGKKSLTRQEIAEHFNRSGIVADNHRMTRFMARAEQVGIVCSGEDKGSKCTYALLEERVPPVPELTKDESLARLARSYFRSHAPAVLQDFVWWSGLPITDARQAIYLMDRHGIFMKIAGLVEKLPAVYIFFLLMMNICLVIKTGQTFCLKSITRKHLPIMVCFIRLFFMKDK